MDMVLTAQALKTRKELELINRSLSEKITVQSADISEKDLSFKSLQENQKVSFEVTTGPKGKQASNIQVVS